LQVVVEVIVEPDNLADLVVQVVEDKVEFLNPVVADQIKQVFPQQFLLVAEGVHLAVMIQVLADLVVLA
jgi:hypothetical protein